MGTHRGLAAVVVFVAFAACSGEGPEQQLTTASTTPSPSPSEAKRVCQPFPDRYVDGLIDAYNDRDLEGLQELVAASEITDVVTAAYGGESSFTDITEWAETGWAAGDRMRSVGYTAFYKSHRGFQIHLMRKSDVLREHDIASVSMTLDGKAKGCEIESLSMSGIVQAKDRPCAFYEEFSDVQDVVANRPSACEDGSGNHARSDLVAVWSGDQALLWGGDRGGSFSFGNLAADGLSFDPGTEGWGRIPEAPGPPFSAEVGVWTGEELLVFGSRGGPVYGGTGAAYNPEHRSWRKLEVPSKWSGFEGVWTGTEVILWGGPDHSSVPSRRGAAYNPTTDTWRTTSRAPVGGRWSHSVAWTGREMIVWGGGDADTDLGDGAAYDPATDSWRPIAPSPISARQWMPITWTGSEIVVWGGSSVSSSRADGAAYNPTTDSWRKLAPSPLKARHHHSVTWTGSEIVVFGGYNFHRSFRDGAAYNPALDSWRRIPRAPIGARFFHAGLWTGSELLVFGGTEEWPMSHGDGALYDPFADRWQRVVPDVGESGDE